MSEPRLTPEEHMMTLGEVFPQEQARARELMAAYREIGPAGMFGAAVIEDVLKRADRAVMEGDVVSMIQIYQELKGLR